MAVLGARAEHALVAAVTLFAACTSEVVGLGPGITDGPAPKDASVADRPTPSDAEVTDGRTPSDAGAATSVFDPSAAVAVPTVATVFEPTAEGSVMQGGDFRLVFTGSTYLLFWLENRAGRVHLVVQQVGPTIGIKRDVLPDPPLTVDDMVEHPPRALVEADRVALAWTTRRAVLMGWTDREGVLVEGPVEVRPVAGLSGQYLTRLHADPAGGYLFFGASYQDRDDGLRVTRVDARGGLRALITVPGAFDPEPFDLTDVVPAGGGWLASWHARRPGRPNDVYTTALDGELRVGEQRVQVSAANVWSGELWPSGAPAFMAARAYDDEGYRLLALDGSIARSVPARIWSQVVPEARGARVGLLAQTGSKTTEPSQGLSTGLAFSAWDPATDTLSPPTVLQRDDGRCLEHAQGVAAGDRAAVAWAMGCSERVLYFAELRAR